MEDFLGPFRPIHQVGMELRFTWVPDEKEHYKVIQLSIIKGYLFRSILPDQSHLQEQERGTVSSNKERESACASFWLHLKWAGFLKAIG